MVETTKGLSRRSDSKFNASKSLSPVPRPKTDGQFSLLYSEYGQTAIPKKEKLSDSSRNEMRQINQVFLKRKQANKLNLPKTKKDKQVTFL